MEKNEMRPAPCTLKFGTSYCSQNFKGSRDLWCGELGGLLSGDMRVAFDSLRVPGDTYMDLREKLRAWRRDN